MCRVLPKLCVHTHNVRLGHIHVPVGFKCEASIPKGEIGFLEGFKHRASHSFQYLTYLFWHSHVSGTTEIVCTLVQCEAGVYTCTCRILM